MVPLLAMTLVLGLLGSGTAAAAAPGRPFGQHSPVAGYTTHRAVIGGHAINYAEGPANGPALLLIHGQSTDWMNYAPVLPDLARQFHVYVVDCYGHGRSAHDPATYHAATIGADLARFITQVIRRPAIVSGHSSGGLIATWMAANAPQQVRGVVLEDPPLFTTEPPRSHKTLNYVDLATVCHEFLASGQTDFTAYYLRHSMALGYVFGNGNHADLDAVLAEHLAHPGEPIHFPTMPSLDEGFRAYGQYDPRFGEAFYTGSFDARFDNAAALARIRVPSVLIQTNWGYSPDGILLGAMDEADAALARSLIKDVTYYKVDSGHGFHFEQPGNFVQILTEFKHRVR